MSRRLYAKSAEYRRVNPIVASRTLSVPGIACRLCGRTWSRWPARLPLDVPSTFPGVRLLKGGVLLVSEHLPLTNSLKQVLELPSSYQLYPGTTLGRLTIKLSAPLTADMTWDEQYGPFVSDRFAQITTQHQLTGCSFVPVNVTVKKGGTFTPPIIRELIVSAVEEITTSAAHIVEECPLCGYRQYSPFASLTVDSWTGNDFFHVRPAGHIIISERAKLVLEESGAATNVQFTPADLVRHPDYPVK
jgi:hypothetical protein